MDQNNQPLEQEIGIEPLMEETEPLMEAQEEIPAEAVQEEAPAVQEAVKEKPLELYTPHFPDTSETQEAAKKKTPVAAIVIAALAVAALIGVCIWLLVKGSNKSEDPKATTSESGDVGMTAGVAEVPSGAYSYTDESLAEGYNDVIVAKLGDHELSNGMLQIFYWDAVNNYVNNNADYMEYLGLDTTVSLSQQKYGEEQTWEEYFLEEAVEMFRQYCTLADGADAADLTMSQEMKDSLESFPDTLAEYAETYGYESGEEYLAELYGPGITIDDVVAHRTLYFKAVTYVQSLNTDVAPTDEQLSEYYDKNAETYAASGITKVDKNVVNVRHILFTPENDVDSDGDGTNDESSDDAWGAAEAAAKDCLVEWEEDPTEDNFASLAELRSQDTGSSSNGGLYEGLYPGRTVEEFNDWCFADERQPGDTGIVKTVYGYHVMYYVSEGDYIHWKAVAKDDYINSLLDEKLNAVLAGVTVKPDYSKVHIFDLIQVAGDKLVSPSGDDSSAE